jgi:hypothetical protein
MEMTADEVKELATRGRIYATKALRLRTGLGLRDALDIVNAYAVAIGMGTMQEQRYTCGECGGSGYKIHKIYVHRG